MPVLPTSAFALADAVPICSPVAGSGEAGTIDEGLNQAQLVTVFCHPILTQPSEACPQDKAGKMGDPNPRKDQEACIVGHQVQVLSTGLSVPTDKPVTRDGFPCRGPKQQAGNGALQSIEGQIFHVFADMPLATEIMVSIHQAMKQIVGSASALHRYQLYRADSAQVGMDRVFIMGNIHNTPPAVAAGVGSR